MPNPFAPLTQLPTVGPVQQDMAPLPTYTPTPDIVYAPNTTGEEYSPWNPSPDPKMVYATPGGSPDSYGKAALMIPGYQKLAWEQQQWDAAELKRQQSATMAGQEYKVRPFSGLSEVNDQEKQLWEYGVDVNGGSSWMDHLRSTEGKALKEAWGTGSYTPPPKPPNMFEQGNQQQPNGGNMFDPTAKTGPTAPATTGGENTDTQPPPEGNNAPAASTGAPPPKWTQPTSPFEGGQQRQGMFGGQAPPVGPMGSGQGNMFGGGANAGQRMNQQRGRPAGMLGGGIGRNQSPGWSQPIVSAFMGG